MFSSETFPTGTLPMNNRRSRCLIVEGSVSLHQRPPSTLCPLHSTPTQFSLNIFFLPTTTWTRQQTQLQPVGRPKSRSTRHTSPFLPTAPHPGGTSGSTRSSRAPASTTHWPALEVTGHEANEDAVSGRGRVTCLRKSGLGEENEARAGNSASRSTGSHPSGACESLGPELTHGDSTHNCIP